MTRFVERDGTGKIVGHFASLQPGTAEEEVADDHPDLLSFEEAMQSRFLDRTIKEFNRLEEIENLKRRLQRLVAFLNLSPEAHLNSVLKSATTRAKGTVSNR